MTIDKAIIDIKDFKQRALEIDKIKNQKLRYSEAGKLANELCKKIGISISASPDYPFGDVAFITIEYGDIYIDTEENELG